MIPTNIFFINWDAVFPSFPEGKLDTYLRIFDNFRTIFDKIFHSVVGFFNDPSCKSCKEGWREIR